MIRELVFDDEMLSQPCEDATPEDAQLAADLVETMLSMDNVAGLAANQVGETKRVIAYIGDNDKTYTMYNPKVKLGMNAQRIEEECLSHPDVPVAVKRFLKCKVTYQELDKNGQFVSKTRDFEGWTATLIQHLIDHCNGKLV